MRFLLSKAFVGAATLLSTSAAFAQELPRLERQGESTKLIVDGKPYLLLAGELHNSSASDPVYMAPIWDRLARNHVGTVIGVASWELVEPQEGRYDFAAIDDQIRQAKAHGIHLVLIWFGAYKNAESTYAPTWVRADSKRFPRAERDPAAKSIGMAAYLRFNPILSVFNDKLADADARAFAALMDHIRKVDRDSTVIMMQVQNETGLLGDSRDRSALAQAAWRQPVPSRLIDYLKSHRSTLTPHLTQVWGKQGFRESGTWAEVFGTDAAADEIFMAWGFGRYVERVTSAGMAKHALPMFTNAWLGPHAKAPNPGDYPSGGPVSRMLDVWKAAAPSLALLAPDIYTDDFNGILTQYRRSDNPILIPEARADAGNLFIALGSHAAIGFSPFGIEDVPDNHELFEAYQLLGGMTSLIVDAQREGRIRGFKLATGGTQKETLGGYDIAVSGPRPTAGMFGAGTGSAEAATRDGYGLVIQTGQDQFVVVGRAVSVNFSSQGAQVEVDSTEQGRFEDGKWKPGRRFNGDERFSLFPAEQIRAVRVTLLKR